MRADAGKQAGKAGAVLVVSGVEGVEEHHIADMEELAVEGGGRNVLIAKLGVGAAEVEEGALSRRADGDDVRKGGGRIGAADESGVDACPFELAEGKAAVLVAPHPPDGADVHLGVDLFQADGGIGHTAAHAALDVRDGGEHPLSG